MSYRLACEVVSHTGSVAAIAEDGSELFFEQMGPRRFAHDLVPLLDQCLRTFGQPSALAVAAGPGSFSGLRASVIAARNIAWLDKIPLHAIDSLQARALQEGPGLWWVLQSLKRDTTFHGCYRVENDGRVETITPVSACLDNQPPTAAPTQAIAIGPAIAEKPELLTTWDAGRTSGSTEALNARAVAQATQHIPASPWQDVLPQYHQASAPELQRAEKLKKRSKKESKS